MTTQVGHELLSLVVDWAKCLSGQRQAAARHSY